MKIYHSLVNGAEPSRPGLPLCTLSDYAGSLVLDLANARGSIMLMLTHHDWHCQMPLSSPAHACEDNGPKAGLPANPAAGPILQHCFSKMTGLTGELYSCLCGSKEYPHGPTASQTQHLTTAPLWIIKQPWLSVM